jgi:hypothetical protein
VRAAFFVDWDPQAFYSLQSHIRELNMILPEWFFIDPITDTLTINIDADALRFMKQYPVKIVPILSNVNLKNMMVILMVNFWPKQYQRVLKGKR